MAKCSWRNGNSCAGSFVAEEQEGEGEEKSVAFCFGSHVDLLLVFVFFCFSSRSVKIDRRLVQSCACRFERFFLCRKNSGLRERNEKKKKKNTGFMTY